MNGRVFLLLLMMLTAPTLLVAQQESSHKSGHGHFAGRRGPVEKLLLHREQLQLTADQVAKLEVIHQEVDEKNRPYVQRLMEIRREVRAQFRAEPELSREQRKEIARRWSQEAHPLKERIDENNHAAMRQVGAVLTPEQRATLHELIKKERERDGRRDHSGRRDDGRR